MRCVRSLAALAALALASAPTARAADKDVETKLPAKAENVHFAGGGKYLVFKLQGVRGLTVYDASTQKLSTIDLPDADFAYGAGGDAAVVFLREKNEIRSFELPSGKQLVAGQETTIQASTDLAFEVSVTNSGDSLESGVEVQLTIPKQPKSIVKTDTIDLIDSGETKTVTFSGFPTLPFGEKVNLRVDVKPVPGESCRLIVGTFAAESRARRRSGSAGGAAGSGNAAPGRRYVYASTAASGSLPCSCLA